MMNWLTTTRRQTKQAIKKFGRSFEKILKEAGLPGLG